MPAADWPKVAAYVLAGCTCWPERIDTHLARMYPNPAAHRPACPIKHPHDFGWYVIRHDARKKNKRPTEAPRWACTCTFKQKTCRHTNALFIGDVEIIDGFGDARGRSTRALPCIVKLTDYGHELFHTMWAERTLRGDL